MNLERGTAAFVEVSLKPSYFTRAGLFWADGYSAKVACSRSRRAALGQGFCELVYCNIQGLNIVLTNSH